MRTRHRAGVSGHVAFSLGVFGLVLPAPLFAGVAGSQTPGSTNYVNGGMSFTGDVPLAASNTRGQYSAAIDPGAGNMLLGSIQGVLTKVNLGTAGAQPTVLGVTTSLGDGFAGNGGGNIAGLTDMVMDNRSATLSQHFAYVGGNTGTGNGTSSYLMKVQMDPPDAAHPNGDPQAAPKVVAALTLPIPNSITSSAIDLVNGYAYFTTFGSGTLVQMNLNDNSIKTVTGLPGNLNYWQMGLAGNSLYISDPTQIQRVKLGANGALPAVLNSSNLDSLTNSNSVATFYVDPDPNHPFAYTGTNQYVVGTTFTDKPSTFTRINIGGATMSEGPGKSLSLPDTSFYSSLGALDPDSHDLLMGTDNALPGSVSKIAGEAAAGPTLLGSVDLPTYGAAQPPPYSSGDLNMRSAVIDPTKGYAYFGTDAGANHVIKAQYSQKGSIKGNKITLPAGAALTSVNFYANMPAPPTASSSGDLRLALYGDSGGLPGALIWQSADIPDNVPSGGGWLSVVSGLPTIATAGDYWLAWQVDSTLDVPSYAVGTAGDGFVFNQDYGAFAGSIPSTTPVGWLTGLTLTSDQWSLNAQFTTVPEPGGLFLGLICCALLGGRRRVV